MFRKLLIANRGEIAVRIIRACKELGIRTVAVYSEVDRTALHVRYADEAYLLGPAPSRASYLRGDLIIDIARRADVDAIHPGYGFLAERAEFAAACADAGITFIGPAPAAISAMGDKAVARATMVRAGVPVIPGTEAEADLSDAELIALAPSIGYPLLIKAKAGGGGKGMRDVPSPELLPGLLKIARREAEAAFGDGGLYLERMILGARHIEVQVLGDQFGNLIHLGERECSLQRRHQKVLEEAPSPFIDQDQEFRDRLGAMALRAAAAVSYHNAGTVECLVDKDRNFYFMEMNTRLQVEHPVTESVTGVDLVKEQIRVARGRKLRYTQDDIKIQGWAIECRINAEDPSNSFMPSTGVISNVISPAGPGVRVDSGVYPGVEISPHYDSLIAKLICSGETRGEAILRMRRALEEYRIIGVKTLIPFHQRILDSHRFLAGHFDTKFIEQRFNLDEAEEGLTTYPEIAAIMATLLAHRRGQLANQVVQRGKRDTSNWKWVGRYERMHR
ncbi:MAG TPA: acetyl-CoA carboxylase biotin carboxylase subunit [Anaerolineales bacterium]|nr:acetyl-CoA carboxylase biotin carboxylase subunit [Anaerolineales bacterium]HRF48918.1 acetyl-CoA carboxylase biotin carboxylase subunit [Anaerolineales bacterium]